MKLVSKLLIAFTMMGMLSTTVIAAEKSAADMRKEATSLYEKADKLVADALIKESSVKSRGYGTSSCVSDCIRAGSWNSSKLYNCRRSCGAY